jgi:hypothetical protein
MARPWLSTLRNEKSVISLFNRNPPANSRDPNPASMVVVIDTALPVASTTEIWLVPTLSSVASSPNSAARFDALPGSAGGGMTAGTGGTPAGGLAIAACSLMKVRRMPR